MCRTCTGAPKEGHLIANTLYTLEVRVIEGPMTEGFIEANPAICRTLEIRGDQTLERLHQAIFRAFDREDDSHLYEFEVGRKPHDRNADRYVLPIIPTDPEEIDDPRATGSVAETVLDDLELRVRRVFWYLFDHGDDWYHRIRVIGIGETEPEVRYPRVIARVGESPPQYLDWEDDEDDGCTAGPPAPPDDVQAERRTQSPRRQRRGTDPQSALQFDDE
jgi:hypothetical protein